MTDYSHVVADKNRGQCAFGQNVQAQKCTVNLSYGKSCSGLISISNKGTIDVSVMIFFLLLFGVCQF